jgi:hypothetical protein
VGRTFESSHPDHHTAYHTAHRCAQDVRIARAAHRPRAPTGATPTRHEDPPPARTSRHVAGHVAASRVRPGAIVAPVRAPLLLIAAASTAALAQQPPPAPAPPPCSAPEHRQFDFWIGEWDVHAGGKLAGTNRITRAFGGCVLHEQYDTPRGYAGASFNAYDAGRRRWHQTWVDNAGTLLQLDGGLVDGRMVLEGETVAADGARTRHRITWTPNADGSVRQRWEQTDTQGAWTVAFDGLYTRRAPTPR